MAKCANCGAPIKNDDPEVRQTWDGHYACDVICKDAYHEDSGIAERLAKRQLVVKQREA